MRAMARAAFPALLMSTCAFAIVAACGGGGGGSNGDSPEAGSDGNASNDGSIAKPSDGAIGDASIDTAIDASTTHPVNVDHACSASLHLELVVLEDAVVRFHYVSNGVKAVDRGWIYDLTKFAGPQSITVDDKASALHIATGALTVDVTGATCSIVVKSLDGATLWSEASPFAVDANGAIALGRKLADGERIYGLGEKTGGSMRRGRSFDMWNSDPAWTDPTGKYQTTSDPIYQSHPYFLSLLAGGHATGAFLANTGRTSFDVGKTANDVLAMGAAAGDMDLFFFDGPTPAAVLERYTRLVGRAPLPPLWALGYHQSRWTYTPSSRVEDVAFAFRQKNLPADGIWLDIDYMDGFRDFTWNPSTFADHAGMLARLASNGFKVTTIFDPGIKSDPGATYAAYNDGLAKNTFIVGTDGAPVIRSCWPGDALFPDFTDPKARSWWGDRIGDFMSAGTRGAWIDMNEPAVFVKEGFPSDAKVNGEGTATTFGEVRNVYAMLMARATYEGQLKAFPNRRPFILTRAGFAGIQRYSAVWTGDAQSTWEHLAMAPSMLQGMGVSGIPFVGSDVGGFTGSPSAELYGRWFELGSLSPFFRSHVATGTPDQEPWSFGPEVLDVAQRMLGVRYALLPYWYESYVAASRTGTPVMRPLWFDAPADDEAAKHDDEVLIGPSILAAPVTATNVTSRAVYVPKGTFYDFYTGASYVGPASVTMPAPLGRFPLFVRGGSVLHEQDVPNYVGESPDARQYLDVYPGPVGTTTTTALTEDDGETLGYTQGQTSTTSIALNVTSDGIALATTARQGAYVPPAHPTILRVHGVPNAPDWAKVDGATVIGLAYDSATRVATFAIPDFAAAHAITLHYDGSTLPAPRQVSVTFNVTLPPGSPAGDVYVASSALGWLPNGQLLVRAGDSASGSMSVLEGTLVKYKVTRGAWSNVEVDGSCASTANRIAVAGGSGTTLAVSVAKWTDACP